MNKFYRPKCLACLDDGLDPSGRRPCTFMGCAAGLKRRATLRRAVPVPSERSDSDRGSDLAPSARIECEDKTQAVRIKAELAKARITAMVGTIARGRWAVFAKATPERVKACVPKHLRRGTIIS